MTNGFGTCCTAFMLCPVSYSLLRCQSHRPNYNPCRPTHANNGLSPLPIPFDKNAGSNYVVLCLIPLRLIQDSLPSPQTSINHLSPGQYLCLSTTLTHGHGINYEKFAALFHRVLSISIHCTSNEVILRKPNSTVHHFTTLTSYRHMYNFSSLFILS